MSDVQEGYKMSEVGVIPEDWEVKEFGEFAYLSKNHINPQHSSKSYPCIELEHLSQETGILLGFVDSKEQLSQKLIFSKGDVLFGKLRPYLKKFYFAEFDGVCTSEMWVIKSYNNSIGQFLFHLVQSNHFLEIANQTSGTKMPRSDWKTVNYEQFPLPPLPEQQAIASALSDVDALITALEQLIAKKRNIKQGAMQQLLTGEKRLPGFGGEWDVKKLGALLDYEQPTKYLVADTEYNDNNDIPVLTAGKTFILGYTNEKSGIYRNLPVIIFDDFTTANKYVTYPFKVKSSAMKILKLKDKNISLRFVFEKIQLIIFQLGDHKRYWISEYQNLEIEVPQPEEQQAIAQILSDMDAEIEALEQKQAKYKAIKQGMMQELLTGKTRLAKEDKT